MGETENKAIEAIGALRYLELRYGRTPSVADIAEQMNVAPATALKYLDEAVKINLITKRDGKFMSHKVAEAFKQKE